jgi:protoporphyrinogen oxidase
MNICIIGGGITGLTAALRLMQSGHTITIYEQSSTLGGLLSSYTIENSQKQYTIERLYHHIFSTDTALLSLLSELNLMQTLEWFSGSTGYCVDSIIHPLTTPLEILKYPHLTFMDKIRLGIFTLTIKKHHIKELDTVTAESFIRKKLGNGLYTSFFEPLLRSKFGSNLEEISAAWLVSRVAIRSDRGVSGERLGYLEHGFSHLVTALTAELEKKTTLLLHTPVTKIEQDRGWKVNGVQYDTVISTIPPSMVTTLGGPASEPVSYQCSMCMTLALPRDVLQGIYWINVADKAPFGAVIGHTNFAPYDWYNEHLVYLAAYAPKPPAPECENEMLDAFCRLFSVKRSEILWHKLAIEPYAGPLYKTGYQTQIQNKNSAPRFFEAGMFSVENYPERSLNGSVMAGEAVAREVIEQAADVTDPIQQE